MVRLIKIWWPSLITFLVVCYATLFPHPIGADSVNLFPGYDKIIHGIMMGGLCGAIYFDWRRSNHILTKQFIIKTALIIAIFAVIDEFLQKILTSNRTFDVFDILAGWGGIIIAIITAPAVVNSIFRRKPRR